MAHWICIWLLCYCFIGPLAKFDAWFTFYGEDAVIPAGEEDAADDDDDDEDEDEDGDARLLQEQL